MIIRIIYILCEQRASKKEYAFSDVSKFPNQLDSLDGPKNSPAIKAIEVSGILIKDLVKAPKESISID